MKEEDFYGHVLYVSGQNNTKHNRTGSRTIADILLSANLLQEEEGVFDVATPMDTATSTSPEVGKTKLEVSNVEVSETSPSPAPPPENDKNIRDSPKISIPLVPSIAINIQLHLPETDNAEVYEKLFRALREQLISPKD